MRQNKAQSRPLCWVARERRLGLQERVDAGVDLRVREGGAAWGLCLHTAVDVQRHVPSSMA
jgi:hypothetical protein